MPNRVFMGLRDCLKRSVLMLFLSLNVFAVIAAEEVVSEPTELSAIESLDKDLAALSEKAKQVSGEEYEALQLQIFQRNQELRRQLQQAIDSESLSKEKLSELVTTQQQVSARTLEYLQQAIRRESEAINQASNDEKLLQVNTFREMHQYLSDTYFAIWQNLTWLEQLGKSEKKALDEFTEQVDERLRLLSASAEYLYQQRRIVSLQVSATPEGEKSALQLTQLILKQRMDIAAKSLRELITVADKLGIETSEYKRQVFETTGEISYEQLNFKVAWSILSSVYDSLLSWLADNAPQQLFQLLVFGAILLLASVVARFARNVVQKATTSKNLKMSMLMQEFFVGMSGRIVWALGILIGLSQIGINLTPVLTGFGIAGVIIGFALQDTLSNFAAGMMLLLYRPFDVGDFVFAGGVDGKVSHMSLVNTTIRTFDNQIIIVPNSKIWGDVIKNVTHERVRRVDMVFGIGYGDDLLKAEAILTEIVESHEAVLRAPEPMIKVHTLNTSSVDFIVRPWVKTDDYWDVYWDVTKAVKLRFDEEGITIPFPQRDVHLHMADGQALGLDVASARSSTDKKS